VQGFDRTPVAPYDLLRYCSVLAEHSTQILPGTPLRLIWKLWQTRVSLNLCSWWCY